MFIDVDTSQEEWFYFFSSSLDPNTGNIIYDEPVKDARVQIRSLTPFVEKRLASRKKAVERVYNPRTRSMDRVSYYADPTPEESQAERDDIWDYAITGIEGFKDSSTGQVITCTRENKLKLMRIPVFDRFVARCLQLLDSAGAKIKEEERENFTDGSDG